ncbi:MAG: helix-turn-helix domain-containing protein [Oscillospiraceae bacterium]|nr:helix-turn-helix domain-containing protein [Oscillospiraceae bacterium]
MIYTYEAVGRRIATERKRLNMSQTDLASKLNLADSSRVTVGQWENGKAVPCLEYMKEMCEIFDCEMDYLFGKINERTREVTDICAVTGLSGKAVELLQAWKNELPNIVPEKYVEADQPFHVILNFIEALICWNEIERLADYANSFQMNLEGGIKGIEDIAALKQFVIDNNLSLDEVYRSSEALYDNAMLCEYNAKDLFGEFMQSLAKLTKQDLRKAQASLKKIFMKGND